MFNREMKRMLYKDARNRIILKILQMVEDSNSLACLHDIEEVFKKHKVQYENLE